jgi:hypothetical protein
VLSELVGGAAAPAATPLPASAKPASPAAPVAPPARSTKPGAVDQSVIDDLLSGGGGT